MEHVHALALLREMNGTGSHCRDWAATQIPCLWTREIRGSLTHPLTRSLAHSLTHITFWGGGGRGALLLARYEIQGSVERRRKRVYLVPQQTLRAVEVLHCPPALVL